MPKFDEIYFHDMMLVAISTVDTIVSMKIEGFDDDDKKIAYILSFIGVKDLTVDDAPLDEMKIEYEFGGVLTLKRDRNGIILIVDWQGFNPSRTLTKSYEFSCDDVQCEVTHWSNPGKTGYLEAMIDDDGNPVPYGSNKSYLFPGK